MTLRWLFHFLLAVVGVLLVWLQPVHAARLRGAPLCDERAASVYAPEPRPQMVDSGSIDISKKPCRTPVMRLEQASPSPREEMRDTREASIDSVMLPVLPLLLGSMRPTAMTWATVESGPRDGYGRRFLRPPR